MTTETPRYLLHRPYWSAPPHAHGPTSQYFDRGVEIEFDGVPEAWMEPMNEAARQRVAARGPRA